MKKANMAFLSMPAISVFAFGAGMFLFGDFSFFIHISSN